MDTVKLKINGIEVEAPKNSTILEAARIAGIRIPTLCYMKEINAIGACRICVVEVKGARALAAACVYPVNEGMEVFTNTPKLREYRKMTLGTDSLQPQNGLPLLLAQRRYLRTAEPRAGIRRRPETLYGFVKI